MNRFQKKIYMHPIFQSKIKTSKRNNGTGWQCFHITSSTVSRSQAGIMGKQAIWGDSCRTRRRWRTLIWSDLVTCCICIIHFRAWLKDPRKLTWICKMTPYWRGDTIHFNKESFLAFMWWLSLLFIYIYILYIYNPSTLPHLVSLHHWSHFAWEKKTSKSKSTTSCSCLPHSCQQLTTGVRCVKQSFAPAGLIWSPTPVAGFLAEGGCSSFWCHTYYTYDICFFQRIEFLVP